MVTIFLLRNFKGRVQTNRKGKIYHDVVQTEMDSVDFNKEFKFYASDKVLAMQLLTHDVMDKILNIVKKYKFNIDIKEEDVEKIYYNSLIFK